MAKTWPERGQCRQEEERGIHVAFKEGTDRKTLKLDGSEIIARARTLKMSGSIGVATVEVFSKKDGTETLCAFCTATMRALDLPAEFR